MPDSDSETDLIIVGIGSSAGGLESLKEFFGAMPSHSGMAFVVIQHLDPGYESYMAAILAKHTQMEVIEAADGMVITADHIYTIPPNKFLRIDKGRLYLSVPQKSDGVRMPIDFFFRLLAEDQRVAKTGNWRLCLCQSCRPIQMLPS